MSTNDIKNEINKVLDHFSDEALAELLKLLKELDSKHDRSMSSSALLNRILHEDKDVLAKLAQ